MKPNVLFYIFIVPFICVLLLLPGCVATNDHSSPADYVNPMIGAVTYGEKSKDAHGFGKTFPGATTPYGLVQLSPDTRTGGDNGPGYSYTHTTIEGFSFTHMSGIGWYGDLGNFLVIPSTGKMHTQKGDDANPEEGYRSRFTHDHEEAAAGYYRVLLTDYQIETELAAAPRAGIIRFTFPASDSARIQIDLSRRIGGTSTEQYVKVIDDQTISGWMVCPPEGGGWGNGSGHADYTVYFYCQFSKPLKDYGAWCADVPDDMVRKREQVVAEGFQKRVAEAKILPNIAETNGKHLGFYTNFRSYESEEILLKCGISFVSMEGARENLETDIPDWDFDRVKREARNLWNDALSQVVVEGAGEDEKTIFYTALYHTMIDPRAFSDYNGQYIGADKQIHHAKDFTYRTIFSGWDVFRSQFPLQTLINPDLVNDEINSLMQMAQLSQKGYYPRWEFLNAYSGCMIGNPAVSVVVDAYRKGIRNYDHARAFEYCKNSVDTFSNQPLGYTPNSISQTLEYAYFDWCVARFAESLGKDSLARDYDRRSLDYRNIWDEQVGWFRARDALGQWKDWTGKTTHGQGCVESNPYQQGWFVPHNIPDLTQLMGGPDSIRQQLIEFFENAPEDFLWNDYYNHPNEPVHHVPFLFNEIGLPSQTQQWTRKICENAYGTDAFGLCGNEDVGQMSAWYVLAAMGIHPGCPGDNKYQITSPVFEKVTLRLDPECYPGKTFNILARNHSHENIYIQSMRLNGKTLDRYWLLHEEIVKGGTLEMEMGPSPVDH